VSERGLERVKVVVERGDGARVIRFSAPRWMVSAAVAALGLALVAGGAWYRDYASLRAQRGEFTALQARLAEQRLVFDAFQERVERIRAEVDSWRGLHDRIWAPFGPEAGQEHRGTAIGGRSASPATLPEDPASGTVEELERLASVVGEETQSLRTLERYVEKAGRVLGALPSRWPVRGPVNSEFGRRNSPWADDALEAHSGMDIGAPRGTPVVAPAAGTVVFAGTQPEYGVSLIIDHGNDIKTLYGHLTRVDVTAEQKVERGQVIAHTGNTGRSSGPHLHYEIQVKGQPVNPRSYLWD
jgi:murein DD-endopeptidase MepM/ murein hydrolase activator NlpD